MKNISKFIYLFFNFHFISFLKTKFQTFQTFFENSEKKFQKISLFLFLFSRDLSCHISKTFFDTKKYEGLFVSYK